jgi:negative regulator of replication initiation
MTFHKIEVDEEIWQFLKKNAEPFEDTPNSVLRRFLLDIDDKTVDESVRTHSYRDLPNFPPSVPQALAQILEVVYKVKKQGLSRTEATNLVARKRTITSQSVIDKYCRQLDKRAHDIDRMLESTDMNELKSLLLERFKRNRDTIREFFSSLNASSGKDRRLKVLIAIADENAADIVCRGLTEQRFFRNWNKNSRP